MVKKPLPSIGCALCVSVLLEDVARIDLECIDALVVDCIIFACSIRRHVQGTLNCSVAEMATEFSVRIWSFAAFVMNVVKLFVVLTSLGSAEDLIGWAVQSGNNVAHMRIQAPRTPLCSSHRQFGKGLITPNLSSWAQHTRVNFLNVLNL